MAFARLDISKFSRGRMPPDPPTSLAATPLVGRTNLQTPPPPKISWPVRLWPNVFSTVKDGELENTDENSKVTTQQTEAIEQ